MSTQPYRMRSLESILHASRQQPPELVLQGLAWSGKSGIFMTNETGHLTPQLFHIVYAGPRSDVECSEDPDAAADLENLS